MQDRLIHGMDAAMWLSIADAIHASVIEATRTDGLRSCLHYALVGSFVVEAITRESHAVSVASMSRRALWRIRPKLFSQPPPVMFVY